MIENKQFRFAARPDVGGPAALFAAAESLLHLDGAEVAKQSMGMHETCDVSAAAFEDDMTGYAGSRFGESARFVRNYPTDLALLEGGFARVGGNA